MDAEYLAAVEQGDMETAQRMVDEAAEKADSKTRNAEQIYKHGKFHNFVSNHPELMNELMDAMEQEYSKQEIAKLVQSYIDAFDGIYGEFTDDMTEKAEKKLIRAYMEEIFADAYADIQRGKYSIQNAKTILKSQTNVVQRAEQTKRATRDTRGAPETGENGTERYSIDEEFEAEIDQWDTDGRPEGESFILGSTGDVLQGLGAIESDIYMLGDKISTILQEHPEMSLKEIKKIPQMLEDPVLILKSRNVRRGTAQNTRLIIYGSVRAQNGTQVLAVLDLRPIEQNLVIDDMQKITSAYTKDNGERFLQRSDVIYADKKRTAKLLRTIGFQMPIELQQSGYIGSISYIGQNVNIFGEKFSDVVRESRDDSRYSIEDTAELDRQWRDTIAEDGMWSEDPEEGAKLLHEIAEGQKNARDKLKARAKKATVPQLKNEIKAAQKRIEDQKKILERAEEMGVTEKVLPEQTENNIRAARESLKIFRAELRSRLKPSEAAEKAGYIKAQLFK